MGKILKKILFALMPIDFQDAEFLEPYTALKNDGHHVEVAGFNGQQAVGMFGHTQKPDHILNAMTTQDFDTYDALIIPGGKGSSEYLWDNQELQHIVCYFHEREKLVATICYASIVPVQAELLTHKHATVYPTDEAKAIFKEHQVIFSDSPCVVLPNEKIITCQGPRFAQTFAQAILDFLN